MIQYFSSKAGKLEQVSAADADWVLVSAPLDYSELELFSEQEELPIDFLTDSLDIDERSRYDKEDDVKLILINTPIFNEDEDNTDAIYITVPIGIILKDEKIITVSSVENPVIDKFLKMRVKGFISGDTRMFVLQIFEQSVIQYLDCLKKLNIKRNLIEKELYNSSRNRELQQLLRIEKSLVYLLNSLSDNDLLKQKLKRTDFLNVRDMELHQDLFEDVIIDNSQALEMAKVHTNILGSTMEAYASIISNNLNVVIHRLTLITIILMVPTLIASFYGMNLEYLPMRQFKGAFFVIIILSFILGIVLVGVFRKPRKI